MHQSDVPVDCTNPSAPACHSRITYAAAVPPTRLAFRFPRTFGKPPASARSKGRSGRSAIWAGFSRTKPLVKGSPRECTPTWRRHGFMTDEAFVLKHKLRALKKNIPTRIGGH